MYAVIVSWIVLCVLPLQAAHAWRADYGYVEVRPGAHMFW